MTELKARRLFEAIPTSKEGFYQPGAFFDGYLKSEADKYHKYNRCLDKAWWCRKLGLVYAISASTHRGWKIARYYDQKAELYRKWRKRWLEIAEKFKE